MDPGRRAVRMRFTSHFARFVSCLLAFGAGAVATTPSANTTATKPSSAITWSPCYPSDNPARLTCGTFSVPLDYDNPSVGRINVTFAKLKASGARSKGNLHFNPGGPGAGSTVDFFKLAAEQPVFSELVTQNYDLIGLDPRGSGRSNNIRCDAGIFNERFNPAPANLTGYEQLADYFRRLGASCEKLSGPVIRHVDTASTVRDFDALRALLGDDRLHYHGISYGTVIGQLYAQLFPDRVGRFVLDAVVDHTATPLYMVYSEATSVEGTLNNFLQWCDANAAQCALAGGGGGGGGGGKGAGARLDDLLGRVRRAPIPAPGCNGTYCRAEVDEYDVQTAIQVGLAAKTASVLGPGWPDLAAALAQGLEGNATALSPALAPYSDEYSTYAILAQDWRGAAGGRDYLNILTLADVYAPRTRAVSSTSLFILAVRAGWPLPARNPNRAIDRGRLASLPPMLVVHAFYDPLCPMAWSDSVHEQLPNSHFVMRNGAGHTSSFTIGETRDAIADWLVNGKLPADGTIYPS